MEQRTWKWTDGHFYRLPSQTNIYGCTKILDPISGTNKLLVASLVGDFFLIDYQRIFDKLTPSTKEVQFTYIPGEAEIVSVDASHKCCHGRGLTIGITFFKMEENESKQFLHIYSASQKGEEFNLENVAQGCQSMELQFIPYYLTHTELVSTGIAETVFLLTGSDNKVHLYREINYQHSFKEYECDDYFPELKDFSSVVLWLDVYYYNKNTRRITACGHQNGSLTVSIVDVTTLEIITQYIVDHDSPITYVKLFSLHNKVCCPSFVPNCKDIKSDEVDDIPELNLLVVSALIPATVYRNVLQTGLKETLFLPDSNKFDALLTGTILDIDFDGENEILVGTYGQEVLAYKLNTETRTPMITKASTVPELESHIDTTDGRERHKSEESDSSAILQYDSKNGASRRVKSEENLSSSLNSDLDYTPLSSSKDTVVPKQTMSNTSLVQSYPLKESMCEESFGLLWQRGFPLPVVGINHLDIMGDGMEDLVIVTLKGIHILQPDLNEVANVVIERLKILSKDQDVADTEEQVSETLEHIMIL